MKALKTASLTLALLFIVTPAFAQGLCFTGEVAFFATNFMPEGYAPAVDVAPLVLANGETLTPGICEKGSTLSETDSNTLYYPEDNYLTEIRFFATPFTPQNFKKADGSTLPIRDNQMLFALIRSDFGGDGQYNFALPNAPALSSTSSSGAPSHFNAYIRSFGVWPNRL